jgi:hypothetical protein
MSPLPAINAFFSSSRRVLKQFLANPTRQQQVGLRALAAPDVSGLPRQTGIYRTKVTVYRISLD